MTLFDLPSHEDPLTGFAEAIRKRSNFRIAWQYFYSATDDARTILSTAIADPACHRFLRDTFEPTYNDMFEIDPIHEHAPVVEAPDRFENVLASGAGGHLGAYDYDNRDATPEELQRVRTAFEALGPYRAFELRPGTQPGCEECKIYNHHLFSSWFYCVAWDWCFIVLWSEWALIVCITDTD